MLFASYKYVGSDWDGDMKRMAANPKVQEWWKMTDSMQESMEPGAAGSAYGPWWTMMQEVFYTK
jgi:L-rhamnose mutarotase